MARSRNIKPALYKNELLGVADPLLTILFTSLWCLADKAGRLEDRPLRIKAETFPYRENIDINGYLTELSRLGFIYRYTVSGLAIIQIINFAKHQNPHHTEKESELPVCLTQSGTCYLTVIAPLSNGINPSDSLIPDSLKPITDSLIPETDTKTAGSKKGKSLSLDWILPKTWCEWALCEKPELNANDIRKMAEAFKDHWIANANQAHAKKADWEATWRNWVRRENTQTIKHKTNGREHARSIAASSIFTPENTKHLQGNIKTVETSNEPIRQLTN